MMNMVAHDLYVMASVENVKPGGAPVISHTVDIKTFNPEIVGRRGGEPETVLRPVVLAINLGPPGVPGLENCPFVGSSASGETNDRRKTTARRMWSPHCINAVLDDDCVARIDFVSGPLDCLERQGSGPGVGVGA